MRTSKRHHRGQLDKPEKKVRELSFENPPAGRVGDTRSRREDREEFPAQRVKSAGRTGGEIPGTDVTADDLAPETLLDESPSRTPSAQQQRAPMDTLLTEVDADDELSADAGKDAEDGTG